MPRYLNLSICHKLMQCWINRTSSLLKCISFKYFSNRNNEIGTIILWIVIRQHWKITFYSEKVLFQCCHEVLLTRNLYSRYPISYCLLTVNNGKDKFNVKANIHIQFGEANNWIWKKKSWSMVDVNAKWYFM